VTLGFRGEFTTGWNEVHGRAANYFYTNGVIRSTPHVGGSEFSTNNAKFLPQPRIGVAWSPLGRKTVIRAGFGIYNDLQDALGYRADQNAPFNPTYSIPNFAVSNFPIDPSAAVPATAKLVPGGVQQDLKNADADFVFVACGTGIVAADFADDRIRRFAWISRADWN